jgi:hypothetical protein
MMRKLAVTVFVLSLAAMGCGSDDGTPAKADTAVSADGSSVKLDVNKDVPNTPDSPATPDLAIDQAPTPDGPAIDVKPSVDVQAGEAGGKQDVKPTVDVQTVDQGKTELDGGKTPVDGGVPVDGGSAIDTASVG